MEILNNCDITATIPAELQTHYKGIIIDVGHSKKDEKRKVIDWKTFEWEKYPKNFKDPLKNLAESWRAENFSVPLMLSELRQCLEGEVEEITKKKMVSNHSKPWIDPKVSSLLKELHEARRHSQRHRSQRNIDRYKDLLDKVSKELEKLHNNYIISECEKLNGMKDHEKWKIMNKLQNHRCNSTVQPIKVKDEYLFEDVEILQEIEMYHIDKPNKEGKRIVSSKSRLRNGRMRQIYPSQVASWIKYYI